VPFSNDRPRTPEKPRLLQRGGLVRLAGVAFGIAALACAFVVARAIRGELSVGHPMHHAVSRAADDSWFDAARDIELRTPRGIVFRGWLRGSTNGAAVLLVDGSGADRTALLPQAHTLSAAGYGVLVYDRPGEGESSGRPYGVDEADFLRVAIDALAGEPGVRADGIGAYGFSSGAAFLAEAAAADTRIRGVVLAGCYTDAEQFVLHFGGQGPLSGWPALWTFRWAGYERPRPLAVIPAIAPRPVFFIVGDEDSVDPPELSEKLYAAASEPKELWIVHGAGHGDYMRVAAPEYARRLVAFFDRALTPAPPARASLRTRP
jgi:pimeloyl-ACP methyl ester carboxylesterase